MSAKRIVESTLDPAQAILSVEVLAGEGWAGEVKTGQFFRIVDLHGNQAADTLFYNANDYTDRYRHVDSHNYEHTATNAHQHSESNTIPNLNSYADFRATVCLCPAESIYLRHEQRVPTCYWTSQEQLDSEP